MYTMHKNAPNNTPSYTHISSYVLQSVQAPGWNLCCCFFFPFFKNLLGSTAIMIREVDIIFSHMLKVELIVNKNC